MDARISVGGDHQRAHVREPALTRAALLRSSALGFTQHPAGHDVDQQPQAARDRAAALDGPLAAPDEGGDGVRPDDAVAAITVRVERVSGHHSLERRPRPDRTEQVRVPVEHAGNHHAEPVVPATPPGQAGVDVVVVLVDQAPRVPVGECVPSALGRAVQQGRALVDGEALSRTSSSPAHGLVDGLQPGQAIRSRPQRRRRARTGIRPRSRPRPGSARRRRHQTPPRIWQCQGRCSRLGSTKPPFAKGTAASQVGSSGAATNSLRRRAPLARGLRHVRALPGRGLDGDRQHLR